MPRKKLPAVPVPSVAVHQDLASRVSSRGARVEIEYRTVFPKDLPPFEVVVGCRAHGSAEARAAAICEIEASMRPAPREEIERWLAELDVITAKRADDEFTDTLRLDAYVKRLSDYPADLVHAALLTVAWRWWPTWEELQRSLDLAVSPRKAMIRALEVPPSLERAPSRPDAATRAEILRANGFGHLVKDAG